MNEFIKNIKEAKKTFNEHGGNGPFWLATTEKTNLSENEIQEINQIGDIEIRQHVGENVIMFEKSLTIEVAGFERQ